MKTILLIRHGMTAGNREKRYIGRTDEPLCGEGIAQVRAVCAPLCDTVFISPALRCRQTADILFPGQTASVLPDLRECDFGAFEGKTAGEMADDPGYRAWVDSFCEEPIPGGEEPAAFRNRCCNAFAHTAPAYDGTLAFVTHGGCIMAILERFALPKRNFYDYRLGSGEWFVCAWDKETLTVTGGTAC